MAQKPESCTSDCGTCGQNCESAFTEGEEGVMMTTLSLDDGTEMEFYVVGTFDVDEQQYIALLPKNPEHGAESEVYLYRYIDEAHGGPATDNIMSDAEYQMAAEEFMRLQDEALRDEIVEEDVNE